MAWKMAGKYVASCSCRNVCPCPTASAPPDNPDGSTVCLGVAAFRVDEGNLDGVDLSGVSFGLFNYFPDIVSSGNWKVGVVVDTSASDEQASAIEQILSGKQGGAFADMSALISEFLGVERGAVNYGDSGGSVGGSSYGYEALRGLDGNPTTMSNAAFGFAPTFEIGSTSGKVEAFGYSFEASYGERADFMFTSEEHEQIRA
jgi:hypothetical protein